MKIFALVILGLVIATSAAGQEGITETQKIDEFARIYCCDFGARVDNAVLTQRANPGSRIYVVFYGARKHRIATRNKLGKEQIVFVNPMRDEFRDFTDGFRQRGSFLKADMSDFVMVDGGYREFLGVEIWIVPSGAEPPALTPTINRKDVIFRKGKAGFFGHVCDSIG